LLHHEADDAAVILIYFSRIIDVVVDCGAH
jgi:hypothetical protein